MYFDPETEKTQDCPKIYALAIQYSMNVITGKWKLPMIGVLLYGNRGFNSLLSELKNITPRMLSKELQELEVNEILQKSVINESLIIYEYELT